MTGKGVPCAPLNQLPDKVQTPPTDPPATSTPVLRDNLTLKNGLPGYLGTPMPTDEISLIRMPHVASYFDTKGVTPETPYVQNQTDYISFTQYGSAIGVYRPDTPFTTSLGDAQLEVDESGGSTILVWPRNLDAAQRGKVFAYARRQGFAIMRGGAANELTTANLFIRLKGASKTYDGAYAPDTNRTRVPCYFGTVQKPAHAGKPWSAVTGDKFVASPANIGTGAPQGVSGDTQVLLDGSLLNKLRSHIRSTGGSYSAR
jgi:hypothetical protein